MRTDYTQGTLGDKLALGVLQVFLQVSNLSRLDGNFSLQVLQHRLLGGQLSFTHLHLCSQTAAATIQTEHVVNMNKYQLNGQK